MEDTKEAHSLQSADWRQHMRSLPAGEPPWPRFVWWLVAGTMLIITSPFVIFFGGAVIGMYFGIGPDQTGGTIWAICGVVPDFGIGALIAYFAKRKGASRRVCRTAFYLFTWPAWLITGLLVWSAAEHFLLK